MKEDVGIVEVGLKRLYRKIVGKVPEGMMMEEIEVIVIE